MIDSSLSLKGQTREISIKKECGKHAEMSITVVPDDMREINDLLSFAQVGTSVEADINSNIIMCGKVRSISGQTTYSGAAVTVFVVSDSLESDITKISRIYQSTDKTYKAIVEKISDKSDFEIKKNELSSKKEENVVIQSNETDFEFANRIAGENNTKLFVCADEKGKPKIIIDDSTSKSKTLKKDDIISAKIDISEYYEAIDLEYKEYIELGTKVKLDTAEYVVVSLNAVMKNGSDRYFMRIEKIIKEHESVVHPVELISLGRAKVTDNKDTENLGRIQVEFLELEDAINDKKIWIQYINTLTAGEGGVFYVPDKDEIVEVICQNEVCYAYGCVREKAASDRINNTDNKSLMLYDKTLVYEEKKITLQAGDYSAQVNEDEVYIKNKDYNIKMNKDGIILGSDKNMITLKNDKIEITVNRKGTITVKDSSVVIDVNSKGKIEVTNQKVETTEGNGKMKLTSGKLEISASSGVDVSTMKFNVK